MCVLTVAVIFNIFIANNITDADTFYKKSRTMI